ncbi:THAP domain-containing protein 5-like [Boleophthalmus pectinirostris]|uniref:THAP domain-containing protein 5-like n=1 Tax=Boleophthalmus pectinirostris TaxID=150288 RepID=UPI000A1C3D7E|nr:THAP domain-containing protein 5-like [Boleophthalmus pectinirostris]
MPKNCSVPHCRTTPGDKKSFYKFPLHDPERLHLWLRNMGKDNWTPSPQQYICHKHFAPSNFKVCFGVRYLKNTAVPTLFQKGKLQGKSERQAKWRWANNNQSIKTLGRVTEATGVQVESSLQLDLSESGQLYKGQDSSQTEMNLLTFKDQPMTLHKIEDFNIAGECKEMVLLCENQEDAHFLTTSEVTDEHREGMEDITCTIVDLSNIYEVDQTADIAYFEIIPNLISSPTPLLTFIPETVLSPALSPQPIASTVPIVSKYTQSSKVMKTSDSENEEEEEEDDVNLDICSFEHQQQVEHCYHKNSVSKEQLQATVVELQRKVNLLQQRHCRHLDKLEELEKTVGQLRQSKLLYEERLQRLERAFFQADVSITDPEQIVTIIYEEENPEYFCTNLPNEKL